MAVSEAAVGFALVLSYFRRKKTYDADDLNELKG
jgi:NADH:ubiquinone oxidoreductase subunit K